MPHSSPVNPLIAGLNAPPIPLVQKSAERYDGARGPLLDLSQAVPGYPAHPLLLGALTEAAGNPDYLGYGDIEGERELRDAYSAHVSNVYKARIESNQIHITSGCNQAFVAASLCVAGSGDSILLVTPYYFNHEATLTMLGIKAKTVEAKAENGFLPDLQAIADAVTADVKAIACVTPNNPTGTLYPPALLERLFDLCAEKNIWLIIDETYRDFLSEKDQLPHALFQKDNWQDHLIGLYSFSKSFCIPGHRLGALTAGEETVKNVAKVMDNLQICAPRAPQAAITKGLIELSDWREENRIEIAERRATLIEVFEELQGWEVITIGAYFSYVRHPYENTSAVEVAQSLAERSGVICLPGTFFGEGQEAMLRIAFANVTAERLRELPDRLG